MPAIIKELFDTAGQLITITLAGLTTGSARESNSLDNSSLLYLDALVMLKVVLQAGTPGSDRTVYVYAWGTSDVDGGILPDTVTGVNAAITLNSPTQLRTIGAIAAPTSAGTFIGGPWSVAAAFNGVMPRKWGIVVRNMTNITFNATESNFTKVYQGVWSQAG